MQTNLWIITHCLGDQDGPQQSRPRRKATCTRYRTPAYKVNSFKSLLYQLQAKTIMQTQPQYKIMSIMLHEVYVKEPKSLEEHIQWASFVTINVEKGIPFYPHHLLQVSATSVSLKITSSLITTSYQEAYILWNVCRTQKYVASQTFCLVFSLFIWYVSMLYATKYLHMPSIPLFKQSLILSKNS